MFRSTRKTIGYVPGAGDRIPEALAELGVTVETIDTKNTSMEQLLQYDAVVTGIRAYNTDPELKHFNSNLLSYVEQGGILLVQYNTNRGLMEGIGPHPFKVTRKRVTVEEAPVSFLQRDNPLLKTPNVLGPQDFEGWVQERGLYFTDEQDRALHKAAGLERPWRGAAGWRIDLLRPRRGTLHIHRYFLLPPAACRRAGCVSPVREPSFEMMNIEWRMANNEC